MYTKPHLSYDEQLELLTGRGLVCADRERAAGLLQAIGYYHLSAYVYPFRVLLPNELQCVGSPVQFREDALTPGTSFEEVEKLWRFDCKLQLKLLDGLETVEIALRTRIAHALGARNPFGHLDRLALNPAACAASSRIQAQRTEIEDAFDEWVARYDKLQSDAKREDYLVHHLHKYGSPVPIWIAVEFLDFGALGRIFGFMLGRDRNSVARSFGLQGPTLAGWLKPLNYLRNLCAHHNRAWNRVMTYKFPNVRQEQLPPDLQHLNRSRLDRVYAPLAAVAYLTRRIDPTSTWYADMRTHLRRLPAVHGMTLATDMGFPGDWEEQAIWRSGTT